jgi:hypothetical protein
MIATAIISSISVKPAARRGKGLVAGFIGETLVTDYRIARAFRHARASPFVGAAAPLVDLAGPGS